MEKAEDQKPLTGRKAVRILLIEPLENDGLRKRKGKSVEDHKAFLTKLCDKLSYCEPETLERLRPILGELAEGPSANLWPEIATIKNFAHRMQAPPDRSDDVLYGWLHSRAGEVAKRLGILLATRLFIKAYRKPPVTSGKSDSFKLAQIKDRQREIDLDMEGIRRRISFQEASNREIDWLRNQEEILAGLEAIVAAGIKHREEKAKAEEGATA
jgi:hypothetical protein